MNRKAILIAILGLLLPLGLVAQVTFWPASTTLFDDGENLQQKLDEGDLGPGPGGFVPDADPDVDHSEYSDHTGSATAHHTPTTNTNAQTLCTGADESLRGDGDCVEPGGGFTPDADPDVDHSEYSDHTGSATAHHTATTNTNAQTICTGADESLRGDGDCVIPAGGFTPDADPDVDHSEYSDHTGSATAHHTATTNTNAQTICTGADESTARRRRLCHSGRGLHARRGSGRRSLGILRPHGQRERGTTRRRRTRTRKRSARGRRMSPARRWGLRHTGRGVHSRRGSGRRSLRVQRPHGQRDGPPHGHDEHQRPDHLHRGR